MNTSAAVTSGDSTTNSSSPLLPSRAFLVNATLFKQQQRQQQEQQQQRQQQEQQQQQQELREMSGPVGSSHAAESLAAATGSAAPSARGAPAEAAGNVTAGSAGAKRFFKALIEVEGFSSTRLVGCKLRVWGSVEFVGLREGPCHLPVVIGLSPLLFFCGLAADRLRDVFHRVPLCSSNGAGKRGGGDQHLLLLRRSQARLDWTLAFPTRLSRHQRQSEQAIVEAAASTPPTTPPCAAAAARAAATREEAGAATGAAAAAAAADLLFMRPAGSLVRGSSISAPAFVLLAAAAARQRREQCRLLLLLINVHTSALGRETKARLLPL
ncbi:hypothetical protein Esti_006651 [Eimeria stiedai]